MLDHKMKSIIYIIQLLIAGKKAQICQKNKYFLINLTFFKGFLFRKTFSSGNGCWDLSGGPRATAPTVSGSVYCQVIK